MSLLKDDYDLVDISVANTKKSRAKLREKNARRYEERKKNLNPTPKGNKPGLLSFTFLAIYKQLYLVGIQVLRQNLRLKRKYRRWRSEKRGAFYDWLEVEVRRFKRVLVNFFDKINAPIVRIKRTYREVKPDIEYEKSKGRFPFREYLAVIEVVWRLIFKILATIFNYTAPVAAAFLLVHIIRTQINEPLVLAVTYQGETIGYIENESEYTDAAQTVNNRLATDGSNAFKISSPHFELLTLSQFNQKKSEGEVASSANQLNANELADKLIASSGGDVSEAYGLYVNNRFLGAVTQKDPVLNEFKTILEKNRKGKPDEKVNFSKSIRFKPGLYPNTSLKPEEEVLAAIRGNETSREIYIVEAGDSPSEIADKTGIPLDVLQELNPDLQDKMFAGSELITQVAKPFMSVQNTYTDVEEEEVEFETVEVEDDNYTKGYTYTFQEGENGLRKVTYKVTEENGVEKNREELSQVMITHPVTRRVTVGTQDPAPTISPSQPTWTQTPQQQQQTRPQQQQTPRPSSGFIRPVAPGVGYVSCYLNGYRGHTGIDIAVIGGTGTPILASASGTVVLAKNTNVGYGRYIIIDHGNGYQTLYAHNSQLYVSVGQYVNQGQVIAAMGRTGNATGVHVHFEVRYNGQIMNPVNYIGSN